MSSELRWNLNSVGVLPAPMSSTPRRAAGIRVHPQLELKPGDFFFSGGLEAGLSPFPMSPLGVPYFDTDPTVYYSLNGGFFFTDDFKLRLGRHHYEKTELEAILTRDSYNVAPIFANLIIPLGWLGGELAFARDSEEGVVQQLHLRPAFYRGDNGAVLGILDGLVTFMLGDQEGDGDLSFAGDITLRDGSPPGSSVVRGTGNAWGMGLAMELDYGIFSGAMGYHRSWGDYFSEDFGHNTETRDAITARVAFSPGRFLLRGSLSFLNELTEENPELFPGRAGDESHWEGQIGYRPVEDLLLSGGYRAVTGFGTGSHFLFLGVQTAFEGGGEL